MVQRLLIFDLLLVDWGFEVKGRDGSSTKVSTRRYLLLFQLIISHLHKSGYKMRRSSLQQ